MAEAQGDSVRQGHFSNDMLNLLVLQKKYQEAEKKAMEILHFNKALNNQQILILTYEYVASVHRELGEYELALAYQDTSLHIAQEIGNEVEYAVGLLFKGNILKYMENYDEANESYKEVN